MVKNYIKSISMICIGVCILSYKCIGYTKADKMVKFINNCRRINQHIPLKLSMLNQNINFQFTNNADKTLYINYIAININNNICANTNQTAVKYEDYDISKINTNQQFNLILPPQQTKQGYYLGKMNLLRCYEIAHHMMHSGGVGGTKKMINIADTILIDDYSNYAKSLILLPIQIIITYSYSNILSTEYKNYYLIYEQL